MVRKLVSSTSVESTRYDKRPMSKKEPKNLFLKPDCGAGLIWPRTEGKLVFRPLPLLDADDTTQWAPYHDEFGGFPWIRRYDVVRFWGPENLSFVINDPEDPHPEWTEDGSRNTVPAFLLMDRVGRAIEEGASKPDWNIRTQMQSRARYEPGMQWLFLSDSYLTQAIVMENGRGPMRETFGLAAHQNSAVVDLDRGPGYDLLLLLRETDETGTWSGDRVIDINEGGFIAVHPVRREDNNTKFRHVPELLSSYHGQRAELASKLVLVANKIKPWRNIVWVPTIEEQVGLLCKTGLPASAIVFALEPEYKNLIPTQIFDAARRGTPTVAVAAPTMIAPPPVGPVGSPVGCNIQPPPQGISAPPRVPTTAGLPTGLESAIAQETAPASVAPPPAAVSIPAPPMGPPSRGNAVLPMPSVVPAGPSARSAVTPSFVATPPAEEAPAEGKTMAYTTPERYATIKARMDMARAGNKAATTS